MIAINDEALNCTVCGSIMGDGEKLYEVGDEMMCKACFCDPEIII